MKPAAYYKVCLETLNPALPSAWSTIAEAYRGRAYHNLDHLGEMLGHLPRLSANLAPAAAPVFGFALIYHDVVYRAGRKDNEARSADLAVAALRQAAASPADQVRCRRLIMATRNHEAETEEEAILVDLDLAVLARDPVGYDRYARAVRREFRRFPAFLYRPGRRKALRHFLEKEYIYHTTTARKNWEEPARENLERELRELSR